MNKSYLLAGMAVFLCVPALAQTTSTTYVSTDQLPIKGDPNRIICQAQEQIGSRLGAKKVCLTAQQWRDKHNEHREFTERIQSGAWAPVSN